MAGSIDFAFYIIALLCFVFFHLGYFNFLCCCLKCLKSYCCFDSHYEIFGNHFIASQIGLGEEICSGEVSSDMFMVYSVGFVFPQADPGVGVAAAAAEFNPR